MKQKLLNKLWLRVGMIVAVMTTALAGTVKAESYEKEYSYDDLEDMLYGSYLDASSYWKVPETAGNTAIITIPITSQPTSGITITFNIATFGSGTNPSSSNTTITAVGTESGSNWSGSGVSTYPSSSTFVNGVMTITKPNSPTTLSGLEITMGVNSGVKIFRLKSITISYTTGSSSTTYSVTYDANGGTGTMTDSKSPYSSGASVTVLGNSFNRDGYTFSKWNTAANGSGTDYHKDDTFIINTNTTLYAQWEEQSSGDAQWVLTSLADLTSTDVFVIVGNGSYAMTNDNGTSGAPATSAVTVTGNAITSTVAANIQWNVSGDATNGYTFYPKGNTSTWLYCNTNASSSNNNNIRVGTGDRKVFELNNNNYLITKDSYTTRYISIYNNADWRGYINTSNGVATMSFYKKVTGGATSPTISADDVDITCSATEGSISYTIANEPTPSGTLTAAVLSGGTIANLTIGTITSSTVPFVCNANTEQTAKTATVRLTYTYGNNETTTKNVTITQAAAPITSDWVVTDLADLTSDDIFVIVGYNESNYAMSNDNGTTNAPAAVSVTVSGDYLTGTVAENIRWNITGNATDGYVFYPNGDAAKWLYCTNTNNGVRVGTNADNKKFKLDSNGFLVNQSTSRYLSHYSNEWRCYGNTSNNPFVVSFYKYVGAPLPVVTAQNVEIAYDVISGSISYEVENPVEGGTLTASTEDDWLTLGNVDTTVPFTCTVNNTAAIRTANVTLTYTYGSESVTKDVTVIQAVDRNALMTISEVRAQETGTVVCTAGIVTSVHNKNAYIQDGAAAILVYNSAANLDVSVGDEIEVMGTLSDYSGMLEITTPTIYVLSSGNSVEPEVMTVAEVNESTKQGWLVKIIAATVTAIESQNVTLTQGESTITVRFNSADDIDFVIDDIITLTGNIGCFNTTQIANPTDVNVVGDSVPVTISAVGYSTLYYSDRNLIVPAGVTAYTYTVDTKLEVSHTYGEGEVIPAGTAVVLKKTTSDTSFSFVSTTDTGTPDANNLLKGSDKAETTTGGTFYYALTLDKDRNPNSVGFYWMNETGAAFTNGAHKAYLALPHNFAWYADPTDPNAAVKGFIALPDEDDPTAIENVNVSVDLNEGIYNLAGQRLQKMQKGINIVNGKKILK